MKRRHYPLVTIASAFLLTVAPLVLLLISFSAQNDGTELVDQPLSASTPKSSQLDTSTPPKPVVPPVHQSPSTRLAMASPSPLPLVTPPTPPPAVENGKAVPVAVQNDVASAAPVPQPLEIVDYRDPQAELQHNALPALAEPGLQDVDALQDIDMASATLPAAPRRPDVNESYYEATGHLALVRQPVVPGAVITAITPAENEAQRKSDSSTKKKFETRRSRKANDESAIGNETLEAADSIRPSTDDDTLPEPVIEDVAIQTPLETQSIGRVENVIGLTRAKGWPVALIKSNLPDDVWWVQQMVGIQGTSFTARVNFGNEYSISGSEYHMVIVFLDSADEVRRFRIAKQFKELPAGVRRSREFHYIRN